MKGGRRGVQVSLKSQDQARCGEATSMRYQSGRASDRGDKSRRLSIQVESGWEDGNECCERKGKRRMRPTRQNVSKRESPKKCNDDFRCTNLSESRSTRRMIFVACERAFFAPDDREHFLLCQIDVCAHTLQVVIIVIIAC